MKFVDLHSEYNIFCRNIKYRWNEVKQSGQYLFGKQLIELETKLPKIIGRKYGVAVGSGTDALLLTLMKEYKKGMPIILPNFGAYPTAIACKHITDNLVYVDVDDSMTMNVDKLPDVRGGIIIPVHLFGNNCRMKEIVEYARNNNHIIIEDCAQSAGSGSGVLGDYSVFSFYPTKPLASMGDGGMICSDKSMDYFKVARSYGVEKGIIGLNSRMDEFQAAVVNAKLNHFKLLSKHRTDIAARYKYQVKGIKVNSNSIYHQFTILFKNREKVIKKLGDIPYMIHYEKHVNEIPVLKGINNSRVNYRVNDKIISLPVHPYLTESQINQIEEFLYENREEEV